MQGFENLPISILISEGHAEIVRCLKVRMQIHCIDWEF